MEMMKIRHVYQPKYTKQACKLDKEEITIEFTSKSLIKKHGSRESTNLTNKRRKYH